MNRNIFIRDIFAFAWHDFKKYAGPLIFLSFLYLVITGRFFYMITIDEQFIKIHRQFFLPFSWLPLFKNARGLALINAFILACAHVIFMQNILSIVYHRSLCWFEIGHTTLQAIGVDFIFYYVALHRLHNPYHIENTFYLLKEITLVESLSALFFFCAVTLVVLILRFRLMFVDLFILEQKCDVYDAFIRSWTVSLGNVVLYMITLIIPAILGLVILSFALLHNLLILYIPCNVFTLGLFFALLVALYGFLFSMNMLVQVHVFKKLVALHEYEIVVENKRV